MASFHRDPRGRSPYWYVSFNDADGKRALRSSKEKNLNKAQELGLRWEREAAIIRASQTKPKQKPNERVFVNGNVVLERFIEASLAASRGEFTEAIARRFIDELLTSVGEKPISGGSTRTFLNEWVDGKRKSRAQGTYLRYRRTIDDFLEFLETRAELQLASIAVTDMENFRDQELRKGKRSATVETSLKTLTAAFNRARRLGLIFSNPVEALESLPRHSAHRRAFTLEELRRLLAVCDADWKGMVLVGYHLGFRIQDCAALHWDDVDVATKVLRYRPQKERRDREAKKTESYLPEELRRYLAGLPHKQGNLFPSLVGIKSGGDFGLSITFRRLLDKAGIGYVDVSDGRGRKFFDLGFHSLRHTCVSVMANAGVSEELRKEHVGHSSDVHRRYTHLQIETFEKALQGVPELLPI